VGWSDLGWAMRKIFGQFRWGANFFVCPRLGHQTLKTHACLLQKIKILIVKVNKTIQIIKCNKKKWSNHSKYNQLESSSVCQAWRNYVCQYSAVYIYNVYTCKFFFIIKVYFPNLDWVGHETFFVRLDGL
jgi:hypothetical protein